MDENEIELIEVTEKMFNNSVVSHGKQFYKLKRYKSLPNKPFSTILSDSTAPQIDSELPSFPLVNDQQPQAIQHDTSILPVTQQPEADVKISKTQSPRNYPKAAAWMPKPQLASTKVCLPGIECLSQLDQVLIHRRIDITECKFYSCVGSALFFAILS